MEAFRSHPQLGYRPAGSRAEYETGEMLKNEMERIGLSHVHKDPVTVDAWEFCKAELTCCLKDGTRRTFQLGAYQTTFQTEGAKEFSLVYAGKGTAADYEGLDVTGKLVLAEINQREEWWINFPVYQACIRGAAAFIAVQEGGYGQVDDTALNAQDIAGPSDAPAFSMSRADAMVLKEAMGEDREIPVWLDADTKVEENRTTYNIIGELPGQEEGVMLLLSAHYDSYFNGFQDDNAAAAMVLGIARTLIRSGYKPRKTILFAALAAEEWGITNSKYDWSAGAYQQVFVTRPQWQGTVMADFNFELPARAHGRKDAVRSVYEYTTFLKDAVQDVPVDPKAYPDGLEIRCPIETMSDDFSMAIAGIPSMVNDFTEGPFMETHYHSQFDNETYYEEAVYRFHHLLYGTLVRKFDQTALPPLDFSVLFAAMEHSLDLRFSETVSRAAQDAAGRLLETARQAKQLGKEVYAWNCRVNKRYEALLDGGQFQEATEFAGRWEKERAALLKAFRKGQDSFVRLNWHDEVFFPQETVRLNLLNLREAKRCLEQNDSRGALEAIYQIDNNRYAFQFDEEVFNYFTDYVFCQPKERLQWGAGRIVHHENLFHLVRSLKNREPRPETDFREELRILTRVENNQKACYESDLVYMIRETEYIMKILKESLWTAIHCTE